MKSQHRRTMLHRKRTDPANELPPANSRHVFRDTIVLRRVLWYGVAIACFCLAMELLKRDGVG